MAPKTAKRFRHVNFWRQLAYRLDIWVTNSPYSKPLLLLYLTLCLIFGAWIALYVVGDATAYDSFWAAVAGAGLDWTFSDSALPDTGPYEACNASAADASHGHGGASMQGAKAPQTCGMAEVPHSLDPVMSPLMRATLVRVVGLLVSIGGMLVTALLLGIVSEAISAKVDELRRGKSPVLESNHALIIGWNSKVFCLIEQLCTGYELKGGRAVRPTWRSPSFTVPAQALCPVFASIFAAGGMCRLTQMQIALQFWKSEAKRSVCISMPCHAHGRGAHPAACGTCLLGRRSWCWRRRTRRSWTRS